MPEPYKNPNNMHDFEEEKVKSLSPQNILPGGGSDSSDFKDASTILSGV